MGKSNPIAAVVAKLFAMNAIDGNNWAPVIPSWILLPASDVSRFIVPLTARGKVFCTVG